MEDQKTPEEFIAFLKKETHLPFYSENGLISKREWKKLAKKQKQLEDKSQKEIWRNKWNKKKR